MFTHANNESSHLPFHQADWVLLPDTEVKQKKNQQWRQCFNSDGHRWSVAARLSDNVITAIFKQHWQTQYVPGLSTAAESIVDSEMLILFVYFPLMFRFSPLQTCLGISMIKTQHCFFILEKKSSQFFFHSSGKRHNPLWWKLCLSNYFHNAVPG